MRAPLVGGRSARGGRAATDAADAAVEAGPAQRAASAQAVCDGHPCAGHPPGRLDWDCGVCRCCRQGGVVGGAERAAQRRASVLARAHPSPRVRRACSDCDRLLLLQVAVLCLDAETVETTTASVHAHTKGRGAPRARPRDCRPSLPRAGIWSTSTMGCGIVPTSAARGAARRRRHTIASKHAQAIDFSSP